MQQFFTYRTDFELSSDVIDYQNAQAYLDEFNMTDILIEDIQYHNKGFEDVIVSVKYQLIEPEYDDRTDSGYIEVVTNKELTKEQKQYVSKWIKGQNSDGIGECFEQQNWSGKDYFGYDSCSFDWGTNDYELTLIN